MPSRPGRWPTPSQQLNLAGEERGWVEGWIPAVGGRALQGLHRGKEAAQERGKGRLVVWAWCLLTLAASDWTQIMLRSARRLELGVARGLHRCQALRTWFASPGRLASFALLWLPGIQSQLLSEPPPRLEQLAAGEPVRARRGPSGSEARGVAAQARAPGAWQRSTLYCFILPPASPPFLPAPLWEPDFRTNQEPGLFSVAVLRPAASRTSSSPP